MRLLFKAKPADHLEIFLGSQVYQRLWQEYGDKIQAAFYRQTGLRFTQKQISVRCHTARASFSGSRNHPMRLTIYADSDDERLAILTHELGHRLLAGHGLRFMGDNDDEVVLEGHKRLYLFLDDAWQEAFGPARARVLRDYELDLLSAKHNHLFREAWDWAMAKPRQARHRELTRLRQAVGR